MGSQQNDSTHDWSHAAGDSRSRCKKCKTARRWPLEVCPNTDKPKPETSVMQTIQAIENAGFRVAIDLLDRPTLWCKECGRDSGFHWSQCSKTAGAKTYIVE